APGAGRVTATTAPPRPGRSLGSFGSVLRAALTPILDADRVEGPADDVVAHPRQVLHPAAADEDDRVLLEIVSDARDVRRDLDAVREPNARDLAEGGIRLLRGSRVDASADTALLRRSLQGRSRLLRALLLTAALHELVDRRHRAKMGPFRK